MCHRSPFGILPHFSTPKKYGSRFRANTVPHDFGSFWEHVSTVEHLFQHISRCIFWALWLRQADGEPFRQSLYGHVSVVLPLTCTLAVYVLNYQMFAKYSQVEPLVRRADIFGAQESDVPQGMLTPPEVNRQGFVTHDVSARRSRFKMQRTLSRVSLGDVSPLPPSLETSPVSEEHTAAGSTSSRTTQEVTVVLVLWIEHCNFVLSPKIPDKK